ncbi:MAG: type II secretion system secretin GspD [Methyloprofundus sp.]|nr:type II secretion system secretin GspD [Methyloprofundus sp.]MDT8425734.1 type II secretion system secretin GspD [Methyloprofundus sp.]
MCKFAQYLSFLLLLSFTTASFATDNTANKTEENITLNFVDADIRSVIATISKETGKNFLIDPRVKGKLTIYSGTPVNANALYDVFLNALRTLGYIAVEQDDIIHIVPLMEAKESSSSINAKSSTNLSAKQVTRVIKIKNISAVKLIPVLRPLMPKESYIAAYASTNLIILSDSEQNIARLMQVIDSMDKASNDEIDIIPLAKADASQILNTLKSMLPKAEAGQSPINLSVDKRTNSILVSGEMMDRYRLKKIINKLDSPTHTNSSHHVVYLKHASATELAPILDQIINSQAKSTKNKTEIKEPSSIIADEATNSIIISSELEEFRSLSGVIKQLDIPRLQVLIEAIITEVSLDASNEIGLQWGIAGQAGNSKGFMGSTKPKDGSLLSAISDMVNGDTGKAAAAAATGGFTGLIANDSFGVLIRALQSDTDFNILSAPRILTVDNKEAEIIVGKNVPFVTGSFTQSSNEGATNPFQTVQRKDVGLTLRVKPQINTGGRIGLEVFQEISTVTEDSGAVDLITTKRSITSNVLINDGKILVLGGLMDDVTADSASGIPWLMDIPYLGWLFKSHSTKVTKRTLLVFLKPKIIQTQYSSDTETSRAFDEIRIEQDKFNQKSLLIQPDPERYQMPDFEPETEESIILPLAIEQ